MAKKTDVHFTQGCRRVICQDRSAGREANIAQLACYMFKPEGWAGLPLCADFISEVDGAAL